jgi:hypothetical protein
MRSGLEPWAPHSRVFAQRRRAETRQGKKERPMPAIVLLSALFVVSVFTVSLGAL